MPTITVLPHPELAPHSRLSCQARVSGKDLTLELPRYTLNHAKE